MPTINGKACVVNGTPVDKVFSDGKQVYSRNLLLGTSRDFVTYTAPNGGWGSFILSNDISETDVNSDSVLTISLDYKNVSYENSRWYIQIAGYDSDNKFVSNIESHFPRFIQQSGRVSSTFTIPDRISGISRPKLCCRDKPSEAYSIDVGAVKLEHGTNDTDWTPAPEDVI